ncbi:MULTISPECIES: hypothetical protein [unclassified Myxococcus]|uniref:hypothetical protein n=2 Tax=Myxococcaceae TaxID=31 RepID=UPI0011465FB7|nr:MULTISPECIES: hypothetical protein [unclassified Myxococcus]
MSQQPGAVQVLEMGTTRRRFCLLAMTVAVAVLVVAGVVALSMFAWQAKRIDRRYSHGHQPHAEGMGSGEWLPSFVPANAVDIVQRHHLDWDVVHGVFSVPSNDVPSLVDELDPIQGECVLSLPVDTLGEFPLKEQEVTCARLRALGFSVFRVEPTLGGVATDKWGYIVLVDERSGAVLYWSDAFR